MSVIQFGDFCFDLELSRLTHANSEVGLDPRQQALLLYFINNPQRVVSRDELQAHIWQGLIVTDNAINKLVANLRKVLNDDAKDPKYIQTVPKIGYRFVAPVSRTSHNNISTDSMVSEAHSENQFSKGWLLLAVFLVIVMSIFWFFQRIYSKPEYGETSALTRFHGSKISPTFIDKQRMLFLNATRRGRSLWLSSGQSDSNVVPQEIDITDSVIENLVGFAGNVLVYHGYSSKCGWYKASFDTQTLKLSTPEKSHTECDSLTVHRSAYDTKNDVIYALAHPKIQEHDNQLYRAKFGEPLERLTLDLDREWRLVSFDLHEQSGKILVNAHSFSGKTASHLYEPETNQLHHLNTFDNLLEHVAWDHGGNGLVFVTQAPSSRLLHYALDSQDTTLLASANERLCCSIVRHPNSKDYVFTSSDKNIDVKWLNSGYSLDNSSVIDSNPLLAHTQEGHYFLSNRTGKTQVFFQKPNEPATLLKELERSARVESMALSEDDTLLLLREKHRLWVVPTSESTEQSDIFIDGYVYSEHWLSNTLFTITLKQGEKKSVWIYNKELQKVAELNGRFRHILPDQAIPQSHYYLDEQSNLYRGTPEQLFANPTPASLALIGQLPKFSNLLIENNILYLVSHYGEALSTYKLEQDSMQFLSKQPLNAYQGFDVNDAQVIFSGKTHYRSEVYRTVAH